MNRRTFHEYNLVHIAGVTLDVIDAPQFQSSLPNNRMRAHIESTIGGQSAGDKLICRIGHEHILKPGEVLRNRKTQKSCRGKHNIAGC